MEAKEATRDNQQKRSKRNRLNLRIDDDDMDLLNAISFEDDETVSQIVRKAIRQYHTMRNARKTF